VGGGPIIGGIVPGCTKVPTELPQEKEEAMVGGCSVVGGAVPLKLGFHSPEMKVEVGDLSAPCRHTKKTAGDSRRQNHVRNPPRRAAAASPKLTAALCRLRSI
jgi:hypothetical protein